MFSTIHSVLSLISTGVIFYFVMAEATANPGNSAFSMSTGEFLAFNAAFGSFFASTLSLGETAMTLLNIVPIWERSKPILEAVPEVDSVKEDPGNLRGEIELNNISFRYSDDTGLVLKDVTVKAQPGEMIAFVGPSGSGKSTTMRLLLGFEKAEQGSIFYDGKDLSTLDVRAVRRQIGVVLQNGKLTAGDIFSNIIGSAPLTIEDAWRAAKMAGLDRDIVDMPMGMHTVVSEDAGTLSGGQRQRLMIARAVVNRSRMIFFDEATKLSKS